MAWLLCPWLIAISSDRRDERYDWLQYLAAGAAFAASLGVAFSHRRVPSFLNRGAAIVGCLASIGVLFVLRDGLPIAAVTVVLCAVTLKLRGESWPHIVAVSAASAVGIVMASRMIFWTQPTSFMQSSPLLASVLATFAVVSFASLRAPHQPVPLPHVWVLRGFDAAAAFVLFVVTNRTTTFGTDGTIHHWSVFAGPAELVRQGGQLMWDVPSQYGLTSVLALAAMPTEDGYSSVRILGALLTFVTAVIVYGVIASSRPNVVVRIVALMAALSSTCLVSGWAPDLLGPQAYPSVSGMRFVWVHIMVAWVLRQAISQRPLPVRSFIVGGYALWLVGVSWAVESATYTTGAWLPAAAAVFLGDAERSVKRFLVSILRASLIAIGLLSLIGASITGYYWARFGHGADFSSFSEYAFAFSGGFGSLPIQPTGAVWALVLLQICFLSTVFPSAKMPSAQLAAVLSAWGGLWAVSSYFVARSHDNNLTNIAPVCVLAAGCLLHSLRWRSRDSSWALTAGGVTTLLIIIVGMSLMNPAAPSVVARGFNDVALVGKGTEYWMKRDTSSPHAGIEAKALALKSASVITVVPNLDMVYDPLPMTANHAWLPLLSPPSMNPLPKERRLIYLRRFLSRTRTGGWLIFPESSGGLEWLLHFLDTEMRAGTQLREQGWVARWYEPVDLVGN